MVDVSATYWTLRVGSTSEQSVLENAGCSPYPLVQRCLDPLGIQPVMTAHPTEAKRRSILNQILRLSDQSDQPDEVLEALWHSDETRAQRVTPFDEVDTTLFFFERTIIPAIARFCAGFDGELRQAYPTVRRVLALTVNSIAFPMQSTG